MKLKALIETIEAIAPPGYAEDWDNTGLLIEPLRTRDMNNVLLTIDLTGAVAREAIRLKTDFIIAYHPLFFGGFHCLEKSNPQAQVAMRLIEKGIGVYSPHTALDAAPGGVNDWLADALGAGEIFCGEDSSARVVELAKPVKLPTLEKRVKGGLRLQHLKTAAASDKTIKTIAVCAGAGIEALRETTADCYLTGEMKHHDVLAARERGISVILCGHTETERGYLKILRRRLRAETGNALTIRISRADTAPLKHT